jgi:hypothetical protein
MCRTYGAGLELFGDPGLAPWVSFFRAYGVLARDAHIVDEMGIGAENWWS